MKDTRYYYKKSYKGRFSLSGSGLFFIILGTLSIIFRYTNIDFLGLSRWRYWLFVPGFLSLSGAIGQYMNDKRMRDCVLSTIKSYNYTSVKVETLAHETSINESNLLRVLMDLRMKEKINYRYDPDNGKILLGQSSNYHPAPKFNEVPRKHQAKHIRPAENAYCPYCGHVNTDTAQFCVNCGSKLY